MRVGEVGHPVYLCFGLLSSGVRKVAGLDGLPPHRPTCVSMSHFPVSRQFVASEIVSFPEESTPMTLSLCGFPDPLAVFITSFHGTGVLLSWLLCGDQSYLMQINFTKTTKA